MMMMASPILITCISLWIAATCTSAFVLPLRVGKTSGSITTKGGRERREGGQCLYSREIIRPFAAANARSSSEEGAKGGSRPQSGGGGGGARKGNGGGGGGQGRNRNIRREEQLQGMKVGQSFEMGYDIEDDNVPLEEDDTLPLIETIAEAADMRKADDIYAIRVSSLTTVSSFFFLATGNSRPQIQAIAGAIEEDVAEKHGIEPRNGGEGTADSGWILLDFGSVVVNIMTPVARKYYALEKLWKKGEVVDLSHLLKPNDSFRPSGSSSVDGEEEIRRGGEGVSPSAMDELKKGEDPFWS